MKVSDLKVKIFADGADLDEMLSIYKKKIVSGFTTNPTLMKRAGVEDYTDFAKRVLGEIQDMPVSFEVFSDEFDVMEKEADVLASYGKNVYVKIPITNSRGESSVPLIGRLAKKGRQLNITSVFTTNQVKNVLAVLPEDSTSIISIFAGRVADAGIDPEDVMKEAKKICRETGHEYVELLWASCREVFNVVQADRCETDIITVTSDVLNKIHLIGKDLEEFSVETVQQLYNDGVSLGFKILE